MAIRIDLHDQAGTCLATAERSLEEYDTLALETAGEIPPRERALRRLMTDLLLALQLTHESVGG